jgi:hypothetical protein
MIRGGAPADPYGLPDLGSVGDRTPPPEPEGPPPGVSWVVCPSCRWRFAVGEVTEVACPTCATTLAVTDGVARVAGT